MSTNRILVVYTPLIFAPLAGFIAAWVAAHVPGVDVAQDDLWAVFVVGMLVALAMAAQWVHGWQKFEARTQESEYLALRLSATEGGPLAVPAPPPERADEDLFDDDLEAFDELEDLDELDDLEFEPATGELHVGDRPAD